MKTVQIFLMSLLCVTAVNAQQTVTTSNKAVFDGGNYSGSGGEILKLGGDTIGSERTFRFVNTGNPNVNVLTSNSSLKVNGTTRYYFNFEKFNIPGSNGVGNTDVIYKDGNGATIFRLREWENQNAVYLTLNKPNTRFIIGGGASSNISHSLQVASGTSYLNGNVGIATEQFIDTADNNQEYKLSVGGRIRAEAVKVYTDWADFVFESDYNLPTLKQVEQHIQEKGHLKDIPSAKEVAQKGIELGEMNKLLLQKIEELTLYTIQQQKQIEALQKDIQTLKTQN